ncbi:MAG: hypothetical protein Q8O74_05580, partial [bacterium]|nr:hypothetical protein [bacterium]
MAAVSVSLMPVRDHQAQAQTRKPIVASLAAGARFASVGIDTIPFILKRSGGEKSLMVLVSVWANVANYVDIEKRSDSAKVVLYLSNHKILHSPTLDNARLLFTENYPDSTRVMSWGWALFSQLDDAISVSDSYAKVDSALIDVSMKSVVSGKRVRLTKMIRQPQTMKK